MPLHRKACLLMATILAMAPEANAFCPTRTRSSLADDCQVTGMCPSDATGTPLFWVPACAGISLFADGTPDVSKDELRQVATASVQTWHQVPCDADGNPPTFEMQLIGDTITPVGYNPTGPNANTVYFRHFWENDDAHRPDTVAITHTTFDVTTAQLLDGDIELNQHDPQSNPSGFIFTTTGVLDEQRVDLQTILTHELGHFQGAAHACDPMAVMWWLAGTDTPRRQLTDDDKDFVCSTYPPNVPDRPPRLCNTTPLNGFASSPNAGPIQGGCRATPTAVPRADLAWAMVAGLIAAYVRRRRRMHE